MTNKFRKWSQVWAAHKEVWINLQPQTIVGLVSAAVDLTPAETSRGVCLGFSGDCTGRSWPKVRFPRAVFPRLSVPNQANSGNRIQHNLQAKTLDRTLWLWNEFTSTSPNFWLSLQCIWQCIMGRKGSGTEDLLVIQGFVGRYAGQWKRSG